MSKRTKGFSLLEAMIALFVLSMITLTFVNSTSVFLSSQQSFVEKGKYDQIADLILQDMMDYRKKTTNPYGSITADAQTFTANDKTLSVSGVSTLPKEGDIFIIDNLSKRFTVDSVSGTTPDSVTITTEENLPTTTITSSNLTFIALKKEDLSCFDGFDLTGSAPASLTNCSSVPDDVSDLFDHWKSIIDTELGSDVTVRTIDVADDGLVTVTLGDGTDNISLAKKIDLCIFDDLPQSVAFTFPGVTNPVVTGIMSHNENPTEHYYFSGQAKKFDSLTSDTPSGGRDENTITCESTHASTCRQNYAWNNSISVFLYRYTGADVRVRPSGCNDSIWSGQCDGVRVNQNDLSLWFIFDEYNHGTGTTDTAQIGQVVDGYNGKGYFKFKVKNLPSDARVLVFDDSSESCLNNISGGTCTGRYQWANAHDGMVIHLGTSNLNDLSDIILELVGNPSPYDISSWRVLKNEPSCLLASNVTGSAHGDNRDREDENECWQYITVKKDSLASSLSSTGTSMVLNDSSIFPSNGNLQVGSEYIEYTANNTSTNTITISQRSIRPKAKISEQIPSTGTSGGWTDQTLNEYSSGDGTSILAGARGAFVKINNEVFKIDYHSAASTNIETGRIRFLARAQLGTSMQQHNVNSVIVNHDMRAQSWPAGTPVYEGPPNSVPVVMDLTGTGNNQRYPRIRMKKKVTLNLSAATVCQ